MEGTILYYVVGPVHPRNMQLIASALPTWEFHMLYESDIWWFNDEALSDIPVKKIPFTAASLDQILDKNEYSAVIFSTVQPRNAPLALLQWALEHEIPAIAIEESNQFGLVSEVENHYLLPVDVLLTTSHYAKRSLITAGIPDDRIQVTGWPFYAGTERIKSEDRPEKKRLIGADPYKPVAALTLAAFNTYGETFQARKKQLEMAAQGLPPKYQLLIKPHPIENPDVLKPFLRDYAPEAILFEGSRPIEELLDASDILLNRGVSQVTVEALLYEIPVVVLSIGENTIFHDVVPEIIARDSGELAEIVTKVETQPNSLDLYAPFFAEHIPYLPQQARRLTCDAIAGIAAKKSINSNRSGLFFDLALYRGWQVDKKAAIGLLTGERVKGVEAEANALRKLLELRAVREDLNILIRRLRGGDREHVLRCLWIEQLDRRRLSVCAADLTWMANFPSVMNIHLFITDCSRWLRVLFRSGKREEAHSFAAALAAAYSGNKALNDMLQEGLLYGGGVFQRCYYQCLRLYKWLYIQLSAIKRML